MSASFPPAHFRAPQAVRPSRAGQDSRPAAPRPLALRPCLRCRKQFKPHARFIFMCGPCKQSPDVKGNG